MGCFFLPLTLAVAAVAVAVRDEGGLEPIVAVFEARLSEEREEASLLVDLVDPMEAMVDVLPSLGTLLVVEVWDSMLAMA